MSSFTVKPLFFNPFQRSLNKSSSTLSTHSIMGKNVRCIPRILILLLPVNTQGYVVSISTGGSDRQSYFLVSWWTTKYCVIKNPHASREISFQIPLELEELREHFRNTQRDASEQCSGFYRPVNGVTQNGMFLCVFVWLFLFFLSHTRIFIRQYNMPLLFPISEVGTLICTAQEPFIRTACPHQRDVHGLHWTKLAWFLFWSEI